MFFKIIFSDFNIKICLTFWQFLTIIICNLNIKLKKTKFLL